jgi:hypothetical protein
LTRDPFHQHHAQKTDPALVAWIVLALVTLVFLSDIWSFLRRRPAEERFILPVLPRLIIGFFQETIWNPFCKRFSKHRREIAKEMHRLGRAERKAAREARKLKPPVK